MRRLLRAASVVVLVLALPGACGDSPAEVLDPEELTYAPELDVDFTKLTRRASGLYVQDMEVGSGAEASSGQTLRLLYEAWLPSGFRFDFATDPADPLEVQIGVGDVIDGWDEGVPGMRVGGMRRLVIPPHLGYGSRAFGPIPGNSTLIFDIRLLSIQ
jgi:FKBP-type peptidyl-prolyl cis-trans isomerase